MDPQTITLDTPIGMLTITGTEAGVSAIRFEDEPAPAATEGPIPLALQEAADQLRAYFAGTRREFNFPCAAQGTAFEQRVWALVDAIPFGETRTYLQIAEALGDRKALRAVGRANGKNPLPIVVPCHRVIGSDGSLIGYGGGLWRKEWLLMHEGRPVQKSLF